VTSKLLRFRCGTETLVLFIVLIRQSYFNLLLNYLTHHADARLIKEMYVENIENII